jgi:hypothetical protein
MSKIKYVETFPEKIEKIFDDSNQYYAFWNERFSQVQVSSCAVKDWKYKRLRLNKDGSVRKKINPVWLHTQEAIKAQKKRFADYQEEKRKEKELIYRKCIKVLNDNGIDISRIDIIVRR